MTAFLAAGKAVVLRCTKCDWTKRVARKDAPGELLDHRDRTCPERLVPIHTPTNSRPRFSRPPGSKPKAASRRRACPTCRGSLRRIHDALTCAAGCTNEAQV